MESKIGRRYIHHLKYSLVGAVALTAGMLAPEHVYAQNQKSNEQSGPTVVDTKAPFVTPVTNIEKPLVAPLLPPNQIYSEPTDPDQIIALAAKYMQISESHVRRIIMCESSGDPTKINPESGARGWWQIMPVHADKFTRRGWDFLKRSLQPYPATVVAIEIRWGPNGLDNWDCK